jgi:hypothetical protein
VPDKYPRRSNKAQKTAITFTVGVSDPSRFSGLPVETTSINPKGNHMDALILEAFAALLYAWLTVLAYAADMAMFIVDPAANPITFLLMTTVIAGIATGLALGIALTPFALLWRLARYSLAPR